MWTAYGARASSNAAPARKSAADAMSQRRKTMSVSAPLEDSASKNGLVRGMGKMAPVRMIRRREDG